MSAVPIEDKAPGGERITPYDLAHLATYLRLLDAAADPTATWQEAARIIFALDPEAQPDRVRRIYDTHLARATWMARCGYRQLAALHLAGKTGPD